MRQLIVLLFLANSLWPAKMVLSQSPIPFESLATVSNTVDEQHNFYSHYQSCSNEIEIIVTSLFVGYKSFFSSQDGKKCTFSPSCSTYAIQTIKKNGIFEGFLDTFDRLTRCNGLAPENYEIDMDQKLLIDFP